MAPGAERRTVAPGEWAWPRTAKEAWRLARRVLGVWGAVTTTVSPYVDFPLGRAAERRRQRELIAGHIGDVQLQLDDLRRRLPFVLHRAVHRH